MKIDAGNSDQEPRIELVPLIDVIFCILTFFLLAGLQVAKQQAIGVDIPQAASGTPAARELLMVTLNDAGQLFVEQQPMLVPGQLVAAVRQYRQARPNSSIVLYASKLVTYNQVVEVLDALRTVAGDRVALATLPTNTAAPTPPVLTTPPGYAYPPSNPAPGVNPPNSQPNSSVTTPLPTIPSSTIPVPATSGATSPTPPAVGQSPQVAPNLPIQPSPSIAPSKSPSP
ncbi:biopolymer transporter ExbD [Chamaesiphon sp.]|uniref:ExbD/TolR family protein n=1 Tax=Chamaesiphon sp. TaxID=2814140 RepID=UPI0035934751